MVDTNAYHNILKCPVHISVFFKIKVNPSGVAFVGNVRRMSFHHHGIAQLLCHFYGFGGGGRNLGPVNRDSVSRKQRL